MIEGWSKRDEEGRWKRITESRYNKWVKREGVPKYLGRIAKYERWSRCRFTVREGMRECKYWMDDENRKCRVCCYEREDWEHVLVRCIGGMDEEKSVTERAI